MVKLSLNAKPRELGNKSVRKDGRRQGQAPAVLYGFEQDNTCLWLDAVRLEAVYAEAGGFSLVDLSIEGKDPVKVIIKEAQRDPVTDRIIHIDLYKVDLNKPVEVSVPIHLFGEAPAVKALGGILIHSVDELDIKCLPENIIKEVRVDISQLQSFEDIIHVASIKLPVEIEVLSNPEQVVASVSAPRVEEKPQEEVVETAEAELAEGEEAKPVEGKEAKPVEGKAK